MAWFFICIFVFSFICNAFNSTNMVLKTLFAETNTYLYHLEKRKKKSQKLMQNRCMCLQRLTGWWSNLNSHFIHHRIGKLICCVRSNRTTCCWFLPRFLLHSRQNHFFLALKCVIKLDLTLSSLLIRSFQQQ